jgi:hypothetical protein
MDSSVQGAHLVRRYFSRSGSEQHDSLAGDEIWCSGNEMEDMSWNRAAFLRRDGRKPDTALDPLHLRKQS